MTSLIGFEFRSRVGSQFTSIPRVVAASGGDIHNSVGSLELTCPYEDAIALGLQDGSEIWVYAIWSDNVSSTLAGTFFVEGTSDVYVTDSGRMRVLQGRTTAAYLEDAIVFPSAWPSGLPSGHAFRDTTAGFVMRTLLARAAERGTLTYIAPTFTGVVDSAGNAWNKTIAELNYTNSTTYLQVMEDLVARGLCDFRMTGTTLDMWNIDSAAVHRDVSVQAGVNMIDQSSATDSRETAQSILVEGDANSIQLVEDGAAVAALGRKRERYVGQGGIADAGVLALLGNEELSISKNIRLEETVGIHPSGTALPWRSFVLGDWIKYTKNLSTEYRVKQFSFSQNSEGKIAFALTLNDILDEEEIKTRRKIDSILGGNSVQYGSLPSPAIDTLAPATPASLTLFASTSLLAPNFVIVRVKAEWPEVTTNTDGSTYGDHSYYAVEHRYTDDDVDDWTSAGTTSDAGLVIDGLPLGRELLVRVKAVDINGNSSGWRQANVILSEDNVPPPKPSTPIVENWLSVIRISWDGLGSSGETQPTDYRKTEIHVSTTNGFTPSSATYFDYFDAKGSTVYSDTVYGGTYYVKLVSIDASGLRSVASDQAFATSQRVTGIDIEKGEIGFNEIAFKNDGSLIPDGSFEDPAYQKTVVDWPAAHNTSISVEFEPVNPVIGVYRGKITTTTVNPWAVPLLPQQGIELAAFPGRPEFIKVTGYESYLVRGFFSTNSTTGGIQLSVDCYDAAGNLLGTGPVVGTTSVAAPALAWTQFSGRSYLRVGTQYIHINILGVGMQAGSIVVFDSMEIRRIVSTEIIEDAAIQRAKIENLAVDDSKIANLSAGKITAGFIDAARIAAGTISADRLTADAIYGKTLYGGSVVASSIASVSISASTISGATINGSVIAGGNVFADLFRTNGAGGNFIEMSASATEFGGNERTIKFISSSHLVGSIYADASSIGLVSGSGGSGGVTVAGAQVNIFGFGLAWDTFECLGNLKMSSPPTTTAAANVHMGSTGFIYKSTSSSRYKQNISSLEVSEDDVLALRAVKYQGIADVERGDDKYYLGMIAEEVSDTSETSEAKQLVVYNADDEPDALDYERVGVFVIPPLQDLIRWKRDMQDWRLEMEEWKNTHG